MPLAKKDADLNWLTHAFGKSWEDWRSIGSEWLQQDKYQNVVRLTALKIFFESYLFDNRLSPLPDYFFTQEPVLRPNLVDCFDGSYSTQEIVLYHNTIVDFMDWVIATYYCVEDDDGEVHPQFANPFQTIGLD